MKTLKDLKQKHKIQTEMSIFFNRISEYLPKLFERSALGDEAVYEAVYEAYIEFRPILVDIIKKEIKK